MGRMTSLFSCHNNGNGIAATVEAVNIGANDSSILIHHSNLNRLTNNCIKKFTKNELDKSLSNNNVTNLLKPYKEL